MDSIYIICEGGGLCNRLKYLIGVWRRSDKFNKSLKIIWRPVRGIMGCHLRDLFENDFNFVDKKPDDTSEENFYGNSGPCHRFCLFPDDIPENFGKTKPVTEKDLECWKNIQDPPKPFQSIDFEYHRIPETLKKELVSYFNKLQPVKEIREIIEKESEKIDDNTIGLHIRRGDHMTKNDRNMGSDDKFFSLIDNEIKKNKNVKFFLATDGINTEKIFKRKFRDRIIIYQKREKGIFHTFGKNISVSRSSIIGCQDALIDIYLLSKCSKIIGTKLSTFTECAWWFGGCKDIIIAE